MKNWNCTLRKHQLDHYLRERDLLNRALWWEPGLGKTAEVLAIAAHNYRIGKINAMLVLAPPGVESNWTINEIPKHWPRDLPMHSFCWSSKRSTTKKYARAYEDFLEFEPPIMRILCMSYNAMMTDRGAKAARKFMDDHDVFYVIDESSAIKTPDAKTTKRVVASSKHAKVRRALNGTPVEDSPLALYTQVRWIDNNIWLKRGISTYGQFKVMFGIWETQHLPNGKSFPQLKAYQNLNTLNEILLEAGERLLKDDCLDLPPKVYDRIYFDISPKARKLYNDLTKYYTATTDAGEVIDAELAIVRLTRFQQIASGYFPRGEDDSELVAIDTTNPRIATLATALDGSTGQVVIFAKYLKDIEAIQKLLDKRGTTYGTYIGSTDDDDRIRIIQEFQDGKIRVFLANKSAAKGITLTAASTVIFYSNLFSADLRSQMEDRCHRIGTTKTVRYVDILGRDTIDEHILAVLRRKKETSATVTGDQLRSWI